MKTWNLVMRKIWDGIKGFYEEEDGVAVLEIILIIVVLIGLVIIFKKQINDLVNKIFKKITSDSNQIIGMTLTRWKV